MEPDLVVVFEDYKQLVVLAESKAHSKAKNKAAGKEGDVEVVVPGVGRIDAVTRGGRPTEVERSSSPAKIAENINKLNKLAGGTLKVPQPNLPVAEQVARQKAKKPILVSNLGGTKKINIRPR